MSASRRSNAGRYAVRHHRSGYRSRMARSAGRRRNRTRRALQVHENNIWSLPMKITASLLTLLIVRQAGDIQINSGRRQLSRRHLRPVVGTEMVKNP